MFTSLAFQIILFFLIFAFAIYAFILADPDNSYIGQLCNNTLPSTILRWVEHMIGQKRCRQLSNVMEHALQIIYLIVVLGSWSIVFAYGYPEIEKSKYIRSYHQYSGYVVFILCMGSWHYACFVEPGSITERTMPLFDHYEYDNILYTNRLCPTLHIRKIARSKYDRCTRRHVPRFDHYCGWINQAVGERNYRWFLLFLIIHVFMCFYGTWVMTSVLYGEIKEKDLLNATFYNAMTGEVVQTDYMIVMHYLFMKHFQLCGVLILMSVMSVLLSIFLAFHLYITSCNLTTNEYFKWRAVKKWHKTMRLKYEKAVKTGKVSEKSSVSKQVKDSDDGDVGCTGPKAGGNLSSEIIEEDEIINPGPMPVNIYNKGILSNFYEVLHPLSSRNEAIQRYMSSKGHGDCRSDFSSTIKVKSKEM
ncbi:hypothetical protein ACHAXH_008494 [Discostella pseudostelligera]